jgi:hypothetical protein
MRAGTSWLGAGALAAVACGCGGGGGSSTDSVHRPALPQVTGLGGPVLTAPKVQPILYDSDTGATDMLAFLQELKSTSYWATTTSQYGVGPLTVLPAITITTTATDPLAMATPKIITTDTITANLAANTEGTSPAWGAADPSTIYLFLFPTGTIERDPTGDCCNDFDGFHDETPVGPQSVPYAIICSCHGFDGPNVDDTQQRTIAISHEIIESSTDPFPNSRPAYVQEDDADIVWSVVTGGEVADMCEFNQDAYSIPPGATYMVQRSWSNAAAAQSQNPCVPAAATVPYFNSVPILDTVSYSPMGVGPFKTQGITIPLGQTKVIDLALFSQAPTPGPWNISVADYNDILTGKPANLALSLDKQSGQSGDIVHLSITAKSSDSYIGGEAFFVFSDYGQLGDPDFQENISLGLVLN